MITKYIKINLIGRSRKLMSTVFGEMPEKYPRVPTAILAERFHVHCDALERTITVVGDTRLNEEFQLLGTMSPSPPAAQPLAYSVAMITENRSKNRYVNILPCKNVYCSNLITRA